ncbi:hypothetical protein ACIQVL_48600 [Streptomyces sp. NPDC090499]|uniref:hypothetical protein n=1 Tax=Streptomyces sp. NPDC090499 TaxID=3365965 RepID=UPI0038073397
MGHGNTDTGETATDSATRRLAELHAYFRGHPVNGPEGHSYTRLGGHATSASPGLPYNERVADHIRTSVTEIVTHTRTANPDAGLPERIADVYDWAREHTQHAPEDVQFRRDVLEYRHRLEHAVQAGDASVVRPHRCPACRTVGLHWQTDRQRAVCVNLHCAKGNNGISRSWTLGRLALEHVAREKSLRECAT